MPNKRKKKFDITKEVKALARERVGKIPSRKLFSSKKLKKRLKELIECETEALKDHKFDFDSSCAGYHRGSIETCKMLMEEF